MDMTRMENSLARYQGLVAGGFAFLVVFAVTMMGVMLWQSFRMGQQAEQLKVVATSTHDSLCALKHDLVVRHNSNVILLRDHPEDPIQAYGLSIPRATIIQNETSQEATIDALKGLICS